MKSYKRLALLIVLLGTTFALNPRHAFSQNTTVSVSTTDSAEGLAIVFPLRVEDPLQFQRLSATPAELHVLLEVFRDALKAPQSLPNGNPFPEAQSISTLLNASFRKQLRASSILNVSIDSLQPRIAALESVSVATLLSLKEFSGVSAILINLYAIVDNKVQFSLWMLRKDGQWAEYVSNNVSMFDLSKSTDDAVIYLINKKLLSSNVLASSEIGTTNGNQALSAQLPEIQPWGGKKEYKDALNAYTFAIGGTAVGISLTFVSAGIWQMYREVAYRNSVFSNASTIFGIAAGACATVTATFLTFAVVDAVKMLKSSQ